MATKEQRKALRHAQAQKAAQTNVARLRALGEPALPMPVVHVDGVPSAEERAEYRERTALHTARYPDYNAGWKRPEPETAKAIWDLLHERLDSALSDLASDDLSAKQALVVALKYCIEAGEEEAPDWEHRSRRIITATGLLDALAAKWSDWFRKLSTEGHRTPAGFVVRIRHLREMNLDMAQKCGRDLLRNELRPRQLWSLITGDWSRKKGRNPLFYVYWVSKRGYQVTLRKDTKILDEFNRIVARDTNIRSRRLLLAEEPSGSPEDRYQLCAAQPYNVVTLGAASKDVLGRLERTHLLFNVTAFKKEYARWKWTIRKVRRWRRWQMKRKGVAYDDLRTRFPLRLRILTRAQNFRNAYRRVRDDIRHAGRQRMVSGASGDFLRIRSGFFRARNRRYHAAHFWPEHVSGKLDQNDRINFPVVLTRTSQRERWFSFEDPDHDLLELSLSFQGFDVSSSQTQILAILLGLRDLERLAGPEAKVPFKVYLAEEAWRAHEQGRLPLNPAAGFKKATDIVDDLKTLWTRTLYGGKIREVVRDNPGCWVVSPVTETEYIEACRTINRLTKEFGGERAQRQRVYKTACEIKTRYNDAVTDAVRSLERFLEDLPWYGKAGDGKLRDYFEACGRIPYWARKPERGEPTDLYTGVIFEDPFDHAAVRWNTVRTARDRPRIAGLKTYMRLPGTRTGRTFHRAVPHPDTGDYPVDVTKLGRQLAPSLIHMLDAFFASLIIQDLASRRIPVVSLQDCWYVPTFVQRRDENGRITSLKVGPELLDETIHDVAATWFNGLGCVYEKLIEYLGDDPDYGAFVRGIKQQWEERRDEGPAAWPTFAVKRAVLGTISAPLMEKRRTPNQGR